MIANYLVLINGKLADTHNYPQFSPIVETQAAFFFKGSAINYKRRLLEKLPLQFHIELRRI